MNLEMHPQGPPLSHNLAAAIAKARGMGVADGVELLDAVDAVNTVETVDPETATNVSAPIAMLTAFLQM
jgi:hypothetical protein